MKIENKCICEHSTGSTHIECCNICGLPLQKEQWYFYLPDENSNQVQAGVSKPIYIVYEACFQGDNLLTAFEDREDAEKYIKRAKKNYYISKPIHLVKAC